MLGAHIAQSLPSGALCFFFGEGVPFKVSQPKKDALFFPMATGHLGSYHYLSGSKRIDMNRTFFGFHMLTFQF